MKIKPYHAVKNAEQWNSQQQQQAVEHAIEITTRYTQQALHSTGQHAMPLAMILLRQSIALMNRSGWSAAQIEEYCRESILTICMKKQTDGTITLAEIGPDVLTATADALKVPKND